MVGKAPLIWIVDAEQWPRAALRAELIERGYDAVGYAGLGEPLALLRIPQPPAKPRAIVLDLQGQEIGEDALEELSRSEIPIILLGGVPDINEPAIRLFKPAVLLKRPIMLGEIADRLQKVVPLPEN